MVNTFIATTNLTLEGSNGGSIEIKKGSQVHLEADADANAWVTVFEDGNTVNINITSKPLLEAILKSVAVKEQELNKHQIVEMSIDTLLVEEAVSLNQLVKYMAESSYVKDKVITEDAGTKVKIPVIKRSNDLSFKEKVSAVMQNVVEKTEDATQITLDSVSISKNGLEESGHLLDTELMFSESLEAVAVRAKSMLESYFGSNAKVEINESNQVTLNTFNVSSDDLKEALAVLDLNVQLEGKGDEKTLSFSKPSRGKIVTSYYEMEDEDDMDDEDEDEMEGKKEANKSINIDFIGSAEDAKSFEKKYKIKVKVKGNTADVSGDQKNIVKFLSSEDYDMDMEDIKDIFPELLESSNISHGELSADKGSDDLSFEDDEMHGDKISADKKKADDGKLVGKAEMENPSAGEVDHKGADNLGFDDHSMGRTDNSGVNSEPDLSDMDMDKDLDFEDYVMGGNKIDADNKKADKVEGKKKETDMDNDDNPDEENDDDLALEAKKKLLPKEIAVAILKSKGDDPVINKVHMSIFDKENLKASLGGMKLPRGMPGPEKGVMTGDLLQAALDTTDEIYLDGSDLVRKDKTIIPNVTKLKLSNVISKLGIK